MAEKDPRSPSQPSQGQGSFQDTTFTETDGETSLGTQQVRWPDALKLHKKLDQILAMLEKWDQRSLQLGDHLPYSLSCQSEEVESAIHSANPAPILQPTVNRKHLAPPTDPLALEMEDSVESDHSDTKKKHRRLSAQNVLKRPGKAKKPRDVPGASVDFATWTEQVRQRCHFDAGALSRGVARNGSKEIERSQVPSIQQMNGAFLQAVTMSKAERHAHFNEVEEQIDFQMERLGQKSEEEDEEKPAFPGLVPQGTGGSLMVPASSDNKNKVPTLVSLSNKSQAAIVGKYDTAEIQIELGQRDVGSKLLLSPVGRLFWLIGPLGILVSGSTIAVNGLIFGADLRLGTGIGQLIYALAAPTGAVLLRMSLRSDDMELALDKLQLFVADFLVQWKQISGTESRIYVVAWVLMLLCFATSCGIDLWYDVPTEDSLSTLKIVLSAVALLIFAFASFMVTLVAYVQSHILLGLDRSLDCWCCSILNDSDFALGVDSWNCLQALLKCIGRGIGSSFLASQACGAIGLIYILASLVTAVFQQGFKPEVMVLEGVHALPLLVFFALNMRVCAHGAALTEKCRVIPAFVNQIPTEDSLDSERQYLVRYVTDSCAGFFVKDAKLTREMFLKNFVTVGGLLTGAVGVLSRIY